MTIQILTGSGSVSASDASISATLITGHAFAPYWFDDLVGESKGEAPHAVRRGVVAAAAFLENYWFMWTQNVLIRQGKTPAELAEHFESKRDPTKWRVPVLVHMWREEMKKVQLQPLEKSDPRWQELEKLARWRHNLMHGRTSRLRVDSAHGLIEPDLTMDELRAASPRWALETARACVEYLHEQSQTAPPGWLRK